MRAFKITLIIKLALNNYIGGIRSIRSELKILALKILGTRSAVSDSRRELFPVDLSSPYRPEERTENILDGTIE